MSGFLLFVRDGSGIGTIEFGFLVGEVAYSIGIRNSGRGLIVISHSFALGSGCYFGPLILRANPGLLGAG
ncbi:hypothetical protein OJ996_19930 [Luteolibacter sp. GHJ8]|uniref:Uncharacterized protein n=1 Tax=Luteolibacter rhizosphaerae TaxID=2989719 RepID=A0ABT3G7N3_9BACT|nr:hypothetical protein [Luteolibacter rhizosphaerae]MCW1915867.1 hypothetical protein [Luteolibacter rhizosphaerae]